nr:PEP-CTERM sorting domain-containing protein [uncultured Rhodopila sp.]
MSIRKLSDRAIVALCATVLGGTVLAGGAHAAAILTFGQSGNGNVITGTQTGSSTTIAAIDAPVTISQIDAVQSTPLSGFLDMNLTSTSGAVPVADNLQQHFSGSFSITSGAGGGGTNYLSGTLIDVAFGSGSEFNLSASTPPIGSVIFTSGVITPADLTGDLGAGFSFANVTDPLSIVDGTFASFTSSVSGTFSANISAIAEPASLALLGAGVFGMGLLRRRRA